MKTVPVFEAKNRLSELLLLAESGEEVAITRRGVAVARLVAIQASGSQGVSRQQAVRLIFEKLHALRDTIALDGDIKSIAREGLD